MTVIEGGLCTPDADPHRMTVWFAKLLLNERIVKFLKNLNFSFVANPATELLPLAL
jgi:hypothetical protein